MTVKSPSESTLARYGLTADEWWAYIPSRRDDDPRSLTYGQVIYYCPICGKTPPSGRFVVDHEHVHGWDKMPPEQRKMYVRGVVCTTCNHFVLTRYGTPAKHRAAAKYLERYARRLAQALREAHDGR